MTLMIQYQYNYDKQSIAQYTALNKDESKLI